MREKGILYFLYWVIIYTFLFWFIRYVLTFTNIEEGILYLFIVGLLTALIIKLLMSINISKNKKIIMSIVLILILLYANTNFVSYSIKSSNKERTGSGLISESMSKEAISNCKKDLNICIEMGESKYGSDITLLKTEEVLTKEEAEKFFYEWRYPLAQIKYDDFVSSAFPKVMYAVSIRRTDGTTVPSVVSCEGESIFSQGRTLIGC